MTMQHDPQPAVRVGSYHPTWHEHKFREILFEIWAAFRKSISKEISRNSGPNLGGIGVSFLFSKFTAFTLAVLLTYLRELLT